MATVTKTFVFASNAEGLAKVADATNLAFAWQGSDSQSASGGCAKWTQGTKSTNQTAKARGGNAETWETWGVPAGAVVTNIRVLHWYTRTAAVTKLTSHTLAIRVVGADNVSVTAADNTNLIAATALTTTIEGSANSWPADRGAGTLRAVDAADQASGTTVHLELEYNCVCGGSSGGASVDLRVDGVAIEITYSLVTTTSYTRGAGYKAYVANRDTTALSAAYVLPSQIAYIDRAEGSDAGTGVDVSITLPAGIEPGDLLIALVVTQSTVSPSGVSGWTGGTIYGWGSGNPYKYRAYTRVAQAGDAGATVSFATIALTAPKVVVRAYRGVIGNNSGGATPTGIVDQNSYSYNGSGTSVQAPSLAATAQDDEWLVNFVLDTGAGSTPSETTTYLSNKVANQTVYGTFDGDARVVAASTVPPRPTVSGATGALLTVAFTIKAELGASNRDRTRTAVYRIPLVNRDTVARPGQYIVGSIFRRDPIRSAYVTTTPWTLSLAKIAATLPDDLLVALVFINASGSSSETCTPPDGSWTSLWTPVKRSSTGTLYGFVKTAVAGDEAAGNFDFLSGAGSGDTIHSSQGVLLCFAGGQLDVALDKHDQANGATIDTPSVTAAENGAVLLSIAAVATHDAAGSPWTPPAGTFKEVSNGVYGSTGQLEVAVKQVGAGATGTLTWNLPATHNGFGAQISIKKSVSAVTTDYARDAVFRIMLTGRDSAAEGAIFRVTLANQDTTKGAVYRLLAGMVSYTRPSTYRALLTASYTRAAAYRALFANQPYTRGAVYRALIGIGTSFTRTTGYRALLASQNYTRGAIYRLLIAADVSYTRAAAYKALLATNFQRTTVYRVLAATASYTRSAAYKALPTVSFTRSAAFKVFSAGLEVALDAAYNIPGAATYDRTRTAIYRLLAAVNQQAQITAAYRLLIGTVSYTRPAAYRALLAAQVLTRGSTYRALLSGQVTTAAAFRALVAGEVIRTASYKAQPTSSHTCGAAYRALLVGVDYTRGAIYRAITTTAYTRSTTYRAKLAVDRTLSSVYRIPGAATTIDYTRTAAYRAYVAGLNYTRSTAYRVLAATASYSRGAAYKALVTVSPTQGALYRLLKADQPFIRTAQFKMLAGVIDLQSTAAFKLLERRDPARAAGYRAYLADRDLTEAAQFLLALARSMDLTGGFVLGWTRDRNLVSTFALPAQKRLTATATYGPRYQIDVKLAAAVAPEPVADRYPDETGLGPRYDIDLEVEP